MIKVVADSTCDLSRAEMEGMGAVMLPLSVSFGPEVFYDGQLSHDEYWEKANLPDTLADLAGLDREEIPVMEVGPVLACHAGPRIVGAFLLGESASR
jgi:fatty acid-binding protein DegV